jgi:hypothetical protein
MIVPSPGPCEMFLKLCKLWGRGVVSTSPNPKAKGPPLVACSRLPMQYIRSYPPYWRTFLHPQPEDVPRRGDRDPLFTDGTITVQNLMSRKTIFKNIGPDVRLLQNSFARSFNFFYLHKSFGFCVIYRPSIWNKIPPFTLRFSTIYHWHKIRIYSLTLVVVKKKKCFAYVFHLPLRKQLNAISTPPRVGTAS